MSATDEERVLSGGAAVITYYSENANRHPAWLSYIELPNGDRFDVRCEGCTEHEVIDRARKLWENTVSKQWMTNRSAARCPPRASAEGWGAPSPAVSPPRPAAGDWGAPLPGPVMAAIEAPHPVAGQTWGQPPGQRSTGLAGTVWMIHHGTRQKLRVPASEVAAYEARGFERGGPRTPFRS